MAVTDNYMRLKTKEKDELFIELFNLKRERTKIDKMIKELEAQYKPDLEGLQSDLFYELSNGLRFSIKASQRAGSIDIKRLEADGIDVGSYRKPSSTVYTLREDK